MNNKGFTLVELIAILVLLVLLVTITYYEISKSIKFAEENTTKESALLVIEAADHYYADLGYVNFPTEGVEIKDLDIKSTGFKSGVVKLINDEYTLVNLYDGVYCINGTKENLEIKRGKC